MPRLFFAEQRQEKNQPVVPVVISWNSKNRPPLIVRFVMVWRCPCVGLSKLIVVGLSAGQRIHLVAAHDQSLPARQGGRDTFYSQCLRAKQARNGICTVESVAKICHPIDPDFVSIPVQFSAKGLRSLEMDRRLHCIECRNN